MLGLLVIHHKTIQRKNNNNKSVQSFYEKFKQCKISFYSINFCFNKIKMSVKHVIIILQEAQKIQDYGYHFYAIYRVCIECSSGKRIPMVIVIGWLVLYYKSYKIILLYLL